MFMWFDPNIKRSCGVGNPGSIVYKWPTVASGVYSGGRTPLGYGSGGDDVAGGIGS